MNKVSTLKYAVLAALLMAVSCAKEPVLSQAYVEEIPQVTFTATMEGGLVSRTTLGGDDLKTVFWSQDDAIKVYSGNNCGKMLIGDISGGLATFSGNLVSGSEIQGYKYWAMYPYTCVSSFSDGDFTANLPARQWGLENSFGEDVSFTIARANPTTDGTYFHFKNACSGIRFKLDFTLGNEDISRVTIYANGGESLAGMFTTSFDPDENPVTKPVSGKSVSRVTLVPASGNSFDKDTWYYMITLPVELQEGFTMVLEGNGIVRTFSYSNSLTFIRSRFRTVTLTSSNAPKVTRQEDEFNQTYYITNTRERDYIDAARESYANDLGEDGYTRTVVSNYTSSSNASQYPDPIPFKWSLTGATKLEFSDDPSFSTSTVISFSNGTTSFNVYNLIPEVTYYYRLYNSSGSIIGGLRSITPKGPVRTIMTYENNKVRNFRDIGGWTAEGGKTVRFGKIYRGYNIDGISGVSLSTFVNSTNTPYSGSSPYYVPLGIKHDMDLRGYDNGTAKQVISSIGYVNFKVKQFMYGSQSSGGGQRPGGSSSSNSYDVNKTGVTAARYQCALRYLIQSVEKDEPVYFHCIGGADRTGTLAFLTGALLGVSELDLNIDYELTSFNDSRLRNNTSDRPFKYLVKYLYSFEGVTLQEKVTNWAKTEFTDSNAEYSKKPLTDDEIEKLKELMLE